MHSSNDTGIRGRPKIGILLSALIIGGALLMGCGQRGSVQVMTEADQSAQEPITLDDPKPLTDFALPSTTGGDLRLSDLRGAYAVLFFGYTHCPDVCPTTLGEYKQVKRELGDAAQDVHFVFVSVDGARDTPQVLAPYIHAFDLAFIGLSGNDATLRPISKEYGLYYELHTNEGTNGNYPVDHSSLSYVVDRDGRLVAMYRYGMDPKAIAADLRARLAGSSRQQRK
jgi:protein SCO1/2